MPYLTFVTGNHDKFLIGSHTFEQYGMSLIQAAPNLDKVQSEDSEYIARHKATSAYNLLRKPVIISDDSWSVPELRGFPGPYMKSINHRLMVDDFLRLFSTLQDRTIILTQLLIYKDDTTEKLLRNDVPGKILTEPAGDTSVPITSIVLLDGDNGKTIAQARADGTSKHNDRLAAQIYHDLANWYKSENYD